MYETPECSKRSTNLHDSRVPHLSKWKKLFHLYIKCENEFDWNTHTRFQNCTPFGFDEEENPVPGSRQRQRTNQQNENDDVWKQGQEVWCFARATDSFDQNSGDENPCNQQKTHQIRNWWTKTVINVVRLLQNFFSAICKISLRCPKLFPISIFTHTK